MIPTRNHVIANIYCKHGQNHLLAITVIWQKKNTTKTNTHDNYTRFVYNLHNQSPHMMK